MNPRTFNRFTVVAAAALLLAATADPALAARYRLHQEGFATGGILAGTFEGTDLDRDGFIHLQAGEVTAFALDWRDDAYLAPFSLGLDDLWDLVWQVDTPQLGDDAAGRMVEGLATRPFNHAGVHLAVGLGPTGWHGTQVVELASGGWSNSPLPMTVSAVPEPAAWALMLAGACGLVAARRRGDRA